MKVTPYVLIGKSTLAALHTRLFEAVEEWRADWGVNPDTVVVTTARAWEALEPMQAQWQRHYANADRAIWFGWRGNDAEQAIQKLMFPPDQRIEVAGTRGATMAAAAAKRALGELMERLAGVFGLAVPDLWEPGQQRSPGELGDHGSGAVLVQVRIGDKPVCCLLDHAAVRAAVPAQRSAAAPLPRLDLADALRAVPCTLHVELGQVELDVVSLMTLAAGDVVRLNTPADLPLAIRGDQGVPLFNAHLGLRDNMMAIEVAGKS